MKITCVLIPWGSKLPQMPHLFLYHLLRSSYFLLHLILLVRPCLVLFTPLFSIMCSCALHFLSSDFETVEWKLDKVLYANIDQFSKMLESCFAMPCLFFYLVSNEIHKIIAKLSDVVEVGFVGETLLWEKKWRAKAKAFAKCCPLDRGPLADKKRKLLAFEPGDDEKSCVLTPWVRKLPQMLQLFPNHLLRSISFILPFQVSTFFFAPSP